MAQQGYVEAWTLHIHAHTNTHLHMMAERARGVWLLSFCVMFFQAYWSLLGLSLLNWFLNRQGYLKQLKLQRMIELECCQLGPL